MKVVVYPMPEDRLHQNNEAFCLLHADRITLTTPSTVQLPVGLEQVARFSRDGDNLELAFKGGRVSLIENFFIETSNGRNDIEFVESD